MHNSLSMLSRTLGDTTNTSKKIPTNPQQSQPASIRLVTAIPYASGPSSEANASFTNNNTNNISFEGSSWGSIPSSVLAPKPESAPKRRLVPKKSKLGLLNVVGHKDKENKRPIASRGAGYHEAEDQSFDIYIDPHVDPDIGDILMVKKKKSRAALDGMHWGPLGEVTNVPASSSNVKKENPKEATQPLQPSAVLKAKGEENSKWWSIGRGRRDSKDKSVKEGKENKQQARAKSPEPTVIRSEAKLASSEPLKLAGDSRARFNSLDSGVLLKSSKPLPPLPLSVGHASDPESEAMFSRTGAPTTGDLPAPPPAASMSAHHHQRSIALRAIRSVRSLARIGSWAQLKKESGSQQEREEKSDEKPKERSKSESERKKEKKSKREKEEKQKAKREKKERAAKEEEVKETTRTKSMSTSSAELDGLPPGAKEDNSHKLNKKMSILGLGLPSSMRLPTLRGGSTASSVVTMNSNRLSVESGILARARSGSVLSNGSSLRPVSTASSNSRVSSNSSSSVRWDEEGLETVKEQRKKERLQRAKEEKERLEKAKEEKKSKKRSEKDKKRKDAESRRSSEGKKRVAISDIFPDDGSFASDEPTPRLLSVSGPLLTVDEASSRDEDKTPTKAARPRPVSDQLTLDKSRPLAMYGNGEEVLSALDAATDDLAQLIKTLNLEATPGGTPTPLRSAFDHPDIDGDATPRPSENPLQRTLRRGMTSIASLRPYAQSLRRTGSQLLGGSKNSVRQATSPLAGEPVIGQQIAPWSKLLDGMSSNKKHVNNPSLTQKAKLSVSPPSSFRKDHRRETTPAPEPEPAPEFVPLRPAARPKISPSQSDESLPSESSESSIELGRGGMFMRDAPCSNTFGSRRRGSINPSENKKLPIPPETKRVLSVSGTMGGSDVPGIYSVPEMDASDHDSDIPDELQFILSANADAASSNDDTLSFSRTNKRGSGPPPSIPLPILNIPTEMTAIGSPSAPIVEDDEQHIDEEEDTIQSFDFTGELRKLTETGGSDRRSFVEQLENAFHTPLKLELGFNFGERVSVPDELPLSRLPFALMKEGGKKENGLTTRSPAFGKQKEKERTTHSELESDSSSFESRIPEPTLPPRRDSLGSGTDDDEPLVPISPGSSRPSNGELNTSFKFGGLPKPAEKKLSLSDIIPPPSHARRLANPPSLAEEEDSLDAVLKSIFAKAKNAPQPRSRLNSNASAKRRSRISARSFLGHSRQSSGLSFTGFDSFEEIRRGFEFKGPRPVFYPPASTVARANNQQRESVLSIPSISSYGRVINPGVVDPFGFSLPCLQERPASEDISSATFSFSVDDTFDFMHRQSRRIRVDSDASSFYFRSSLPSMSQDRSSRRESGISIISRPVSIYNKDFTIDSRGDSSVSGGSAATHEAIGGRPAWARHRQDPSIDSVINDLSGLKLGRPGLGDKMFDTSFHQDTDPSPSYASSSPSDYDQSSQILPPEYQRDSMCDSVMDVDEARLSGDSLFDNTNQQTSDLTGSVFGDTRAHGFLQPFRPLSVLSTLSVQSAPKEDDTWISMIGGGQIRRNSVASVLQTSPCARAEKRKKKVFHPAHHEEEHVSPKKVKITMEPSIVSTSSSKFGGSEQMIGTTQDISERQSLEDSVLVGRGEDTSVPFGSIPVFSRPLPVGRSRSSTCTSSSGADTPPLSTDGSSISGGSQSSIDLGHLNSLLANSSLPMSNPSAARTRTRLRARGQGHRRRYSARISRRSVYETIEEETNISPARTMMTAKSATPTTQPVIVITSDSGDLTVSDGSLWDSEQGIITLDQYYALRNEADHTVVESKRMWADTPFSLFAVQNFRPPRNPESMKALLQHSVQNFGPLPSELRPRRRSRTFSRPSPYPLARVSRVFHAPESKSDFPHNGPLSQVPGVLQDVHVYSNVPPSPAPSFTFRALSPEKEAFNKSPFGRPAVRPRAGSTARRVAKRKSSSVGQKENKENKENVSTGSAKSQGDSLRLNRPRPRGRPGTTAQPAQPRPIRI